jgi:hypothetical protein
MTLTRGDPLVIGMPWDAFLSHMSAHWHPGQHIAMIGPTGEGKSTFAGGLLSLRKYVLALDPKGEDETLSATGFERVFKVPTEITFSERVMRTPHARQWDAIHQRIAEGGDARLIVGASTRTSAEDARNQALMREAITYCRQATGWTLYVDEYELLSSQRMYNLGPPIERMLNTARTLGTSVVTSYQAPAWVSHHSSRQARFMVTWATGDRDMIKKMANSMGRDWRQVAAAIDELPRFHALVIPRGRNGGPLIVTSAPRL